jgi:hypothetical protein
MDRWTNGEKEFLPDTEAYFGKKFHNLREKWIQLEQEGCRMQSDWYSESDSQLKICKYMLLTVGSLCKLGGLESPDQPRLRSRLLIVSRSTFETYQHFLNCRDLLFDSVEMESFDRDMIETNQVPRSSLSLSFHVLCENALSKKTR